VRLKNVYAGKKPCLRIHDTSRLAKEKEENGRQRRSEKGQESLTKTFEATHQKVSDWKSKSQQDL
jgi:hypothetical protein